MKTRFALPTRALRACVIFFGVLAFAALAAENVNVARALQIALKERGFYTAAQPSGVMDEPTRAALKRFQIREGLSVTGEPDTATLQALGNPAATKNKIAASSLSARERAQQIASSDREFLAGVEAMEHRAEPPQRVPPTPRARVSPSSVPPPVAEPPPDRNPSAVSEDAVAQFVENYLKAAEGPTPAAEVAHYAEQVDYFDNGKVSRDFIRKDQARYYKRWPIRDFKLLGAPRIERTSPDGATIRFRVAYALKGNGEKAAGRTEEVVRLHRQGAALRIAGIRERKLE
jgi:hypothetical protein